MRDRSGGVSEKPQYIYEDGNVIDRLGWKMPRGRQRVIGSLIVDTEDETTIATSFVSFVNTCGYEGCRCHGEYEQKRFSSWHDADAWLIELNERKETADA